MNVYKRLIDVPGKPSACSPPVGIVSGESVGFWLILPSLSKATSPGNWGVLGIRTNSPKPRLGMSMEIRCVFAEVIELPPVDAFGTAETQTCGATFSFGLKCCTFHREEGEPVCALCRRPG